MRDAPVASRAAAVGAAVLVVGLVVEHVLTDVAVNGVDLSLPAGKVVLVSVSETALWVLWLAVAERVGGVEGLLAAGAVLAVLLVPQHTVEDGVLRGEGLLSDLVDLGTLGFSVIEAAGATVWLALVVRPGLFAPTLSRLLAGTPAAGTDPAAVGLGVLVAALLVEHSVGVRFSRR